MFPLYLLFWNYKNSFQIIQWQIFYVSLTKHIFVFIVSVFFILKQ